MRKLFAISLTLIGFTAIIGQIVLIRELMVLFYGNELTVGFMLGAWLLWTAAGSGLVGRMLSKLKRLRLTYGLTQLGLALLVPASIVAIRASQVIWGRTQGEITGLVPIMVTTLVTLGPFCIFSGSLYTLGCNIFSRKLEKASVSIGRVYVLEAIGAGLGGFLASFVLIRFLSSFQIAGLLSFLNIFISWLLLSEYLSNKLLKKILTFSIVSLSVLLVFLGYPYLDRLSNRLLWKGFNLIHTENTIYGNIALTRLEESTSFFENGLLMYTQPDIFYAEEAVHFALLEHPDPRRLLLIGGGIGGSLKQALLHPQLEHVDYVELDPKVIQLSRAFLPEEETKVLQDPRVEVWNVDGRFFVKKSKQKYDVIIINLPDPHTALINRFYTVEFFQETAKILNEKGILSFRVTSSENAIGRDLSHFLSCLYQTLSRVFQEIVLIPGDTNHFIASIGQGVLTQDPNVLVQRLNQRQLPTQYIRDYYLPYRMSKERVAYLFSNIKLSPKLELNQDFKPVGYFYDIILWSTYFTQSFRSIFIRVSQIGFKGIIAVCLLIVAIFLPLALTSRGRKASFHRGIIVSLMIIGFSEIALEVILILGFQTLYGYVYYQLALILTGYMVGLTIGSLISTQYLPKLNHPFRAFKGVQLLMVLFPLIIIGMLSFLSKSKQPITNPYVIQFIFTVLIAMAGFIGGYQFPLANDLYLKAEARLTKVAGTLYATDLVGSCLGAMIVSALLIPILGIFRACLALTGLNLAALIIVLVARKPTQESG